MRTEKGKTQDSPREDWEQIAKLQAEFELKKRGGEHLKAQIERNDRIIKKQMKENLLVAVSRDTLNENMVAHFEDLLRSTQPMEIIETLFKCYTLAAEQNDERANLVTLENMIQTFIDIERERHHLPKPMPRVSKN